MAEISIEFYEQSQNAESHDFVDISGLKSFEKQSSQDVYLLFSILLP